jgi:hypothetical protein
MALARTLDPSTSHAAAKSVIDGRPTMKIIMDILRHGDASDEVIAYVYTGLVDAGRAPQASPSGLRSRRAELVDLGMVEDSGQRTLLMTNRRAIVWRLTEVARIHD